MRSVILILIWLMGVSPSLAGRIGDDTGGLIDTYVERFSRMRDSRERMVVDGQCLSACTLVLAFVPRDRMCVTPNAAFGFHSAWSYDAQGGQAVDREATRFLWDMYPERIRQWIRMNGGLRQRLVYLRGRQLAALLPTCSPGLDRGDQSEHAQVATPGARRAGGARHAVSATTATAGRQHAPASAFSASHAFPR